MSFSAGTLEQGFFHFELFSTFMEFLLPSWGVGTSLKHDTRTTSHQQTAPTNNATNHGPYNLPFNS